MPFGNERKSVELHIPVFQWFAKASTAFTENKPGYAALTGEEFPLHRFLLANALPLTKSMLGVGLATAGLLLIERFSPALVPIVYLIPVIVAATRWGTWAAITAAITSAAAADFFFYPPF